MKYSALSGLAALAAFAQAADVPTIEVVGRKFFYSNNGSQFYIKGVAYQSNSIVNQTGSSFNDPLADQDSVKRDVPYLQQLQTNTVRVYAVNSSLNHDQAMQELNDAGIYVLADLAEPGLSIESNDPQWNIELFNRYASVVDTFANYSNVLGFIAGNEVINLANETQAAPFVKAAVRDVKAYIKQKGYRSIPVGYSASDVASVRVAEADYFACGDSDVQADFFATNIYEWCGDSTFQTSGYAARTQEMQNMTIPVFFSEYGCNKVQPRTFSDTQALFSSNMTGVWSGGIVYEYFQEANDYGLVTVSGNSVTTNQDFENLSSVMAKISPSSAHSSDAQANKTTMACPPTNEPQWHAATNLPPTPDAGVCDCISDSSNCVVSSDVSSKDYQDLFSYLCGVVSCDAISANGTSGKYGALSPCSPKQQLDYLMNLYYQQNSQSASACDFSGSGSLKTGIQTASSCSAVYSQLGSSGTGSISQGTSINVGTSIVGAQATANDSQGGSNSATTGSSSKSSGSGSKSSSSKSSSSSSSSKNAAPATGNVKVAAGVLGGALAVLVGAL